MALADIWFAVNVCIHFINYPCNLPTTSLLFHFKISQHPTLFLANKKPTNLQTINYILYTLSISNELQHLLLSLVDFTYSSKFANIQTITDLLDH